MGALLIHIVNDNWVADIANTSVSYNFVGLHAPNQINAIQDLANAMQQGQGALVDGIDQIFVLAPGVDEGGVVQEVFGTTDAIMFDQAIIYSNADSLLIDVLEDAGEALATALAG